MQSHTDSHIGSSATRDKERVEDDVTSDGHGIGQISINLVENVFRWTSQEDRARLGSLAFDEEGIVSVQRSAQDKARSKAELTHPQFSRY